MSRYEHKKIEKKWQQFWQESQSFKATEDASKPKYYVLDMFPYPSGAGLHVGHPVGYTATDIVTRYKLAKGFNVLHPMGWDAFGLPAEQYAVRTGQHPAVTTKENVETYKRQLSALGLAYDWDREINTTDPHYYKWTQWIFTELYRAGLAYEAEVEVNYCPALGTVLANEEVEGGRSLIGDHPVEKRPIRQWMLRITKYADRLLNDLEGLDWPEHIKRAQRNWIGRSVGVQVEFQDETTGEEIHVFTTRVDTLPGVTFVVLSPEHPRVDRITTKEHRADVTAYQEKTAGCSDVERMEHAKDKTGVFTGAYAINPLNNERVPIWIADYVLMSYGTGAVMAVPAHDERDQDFAEKFDLPIRPVDEVGEATIERIATWLEERGKGKRTINYRLRDWLFSRQRYWGEPIPILHFEDGTMRCLDLDELPLVPPEVDDYKPSADGLSPLAKVTEWVEITDPKTGKKARRETNTMPQWAGSSWYYLRYADPHNDTAFSAPEKQKAWVPVDLYIGGAEHATLHLLYARFWHKVLYDLGHVQTSEPFQKLYNQGLLTARSFRYPRGGYVSPHDAMQEGETWVHRESEEPLATQIEKMSKSKLNVVNPDEIIEDFGADSLRLYLMFMGPLDKEKVWITDGVTGCRRFLNRFFELATSDKLTDDTSEPALRLAHRLVHDVSTDIENLHFNTAIAKMMSFVNDLTKLDAYPRTVIALATQCLAPFAPHISEEIWQLLGNQHSILKASFPTPDPAYLTQATCTYIVQVNGKLRGRFDLPKDQDEATIVALAQKDERIAKHLEGTLRKVIFVPNRLLNFVVS
jgi:leucyl-tRNA synthetase